MTRLAQRSSLLVAFYLLASTATASADCAWVLWRSSGTVHTWQPNDAFDDRQSCQKRQSEEILNLSKLRKENSLLGQGSFLCLPSGTDQRPRYKEQGDIVDQRGPKGK
jgi:hypothetical protein